MRYTEYHAGKAVIKDKSELSEAMEKLAKLEDKEKSGEWIDAVELAKIAIALERNRPQSPVSFGDGAYLCPNCKKNNFYYGTETLHMTKYCSYCGQKIDWSQINEQTN